MKKVSKNFIIAGRRNWYGGRLQRDLNDLRGIAKDISCFSPREVVKLNNSILFLEDVIRGWNDSYKEVRRLNNMKTYEKV